MCASLERAPATPPLPPCGPDLAPLLDVLGELAEALRNDAGAAASLAVPEAVVFAASRARGDPIGPTALALVQHIDGAFAGAVFGPLEPDERLEVIGDEVHKVHGGQRLALRLTADMHRPHAHRPCSERTLTLETDFVTFRLLSREPGRAETAVLATYEAAGLCREVEIAGPLWASLFPIFRTIVTRTISLAIPRTAPGVLFSSSAGGARNVLTSILSGRRKSEEQSALQRLRCLVRGEERLLTICALAQTLETQPDGPRVLSVENQGPYRLTRYAPGRSAVADLGGGLRQPARRDVVTSYIDDVTGHEHHREFMIAPQDWGTHEESLRHAAFDVLHMLAVRRTKLFRAGFAHRVFTVMLPPGLVSLRSDPAVSHAMFPCLTLYRQPRDGSFRRTLTVTLVTFPVQVSSGPPLSPTLTSRAAPLRESQGFRAHLKAVGKSDGAYDLAGPLAGYLGLGGATTSPARLLEHMATQVLRRVLGDPRGGYALANRAQQMRRLIGETTFLALTESRMCSLLLQVGWSAPEGFRRPWERWLAGEEDPAFQAVLFRTLFYDDFLDPLLGDASPVAVDLKALNVGNTLGADMHGMTLFYPQDETKYVIYPRTLERFPDHSMVRWMAWSVFTDSALASLKAMIAKFHSSLDSPGELRDIITTLDAMIEEFVEFYDLDIREFDYRTEYEKMRNLVKVDSDYAFLLSRFESAKEEASLKEGRLINKLLVSFTLATVSVTVLTSVSEGEKWDPLPYVGVAVSVSATIALTGYLLFDPLRRAYGRARGRRSR